MVFINTSGAVHVGLGDFDTPIKGYKPAQSLASQDQQNGGMVIKVDSGQQSPGSITSITEAANNGGANRRSFFVTNFKDPLGRKVNVSA